MQILYEAIKKTSSMEVSIVLVYGAEGRTRTGTQCELRQILSLMRLPISPLRLVFKFYNNHKNFSTTFFRFATFSKHLFLFSLKISPFPLLNPYSLIKINLAKNIRKIKKIKYFN